MIPRALSVARPPQSDGVAVTDHVGLWPQSPAGRGEHVVAAGRILLAVLGLLVVWLDPRAPARHAPAAYVVMAAYVVYSTAILLAVWKSNLSIRVVQIATHGIDLVLFLLFIYLTEGGTSPFFAYLTFAILAGAVRWQWRGALATAAVALVAYVGLGFFAANVLKDPAFDVNRFILRSMYLAVLACFVAYLSAYEERVRVEIRKLADWPRPVSLDTPELVKHLLGHAAHILSAPRVLMVWNEPGHASLRAASWSPAECSLVDAPSDWGDSVIDEQLAGVAFVWTNTSMQDRVLVSTAAGFREWRGAPFDSRFLADIAARSVVAIPLPSEQLAGWVFYLDKRRPTSDDVALAAISTREIGTTLDYAELLAQLRDVAVEDERTRLGRDLHDGLLQSLTAARLQLHQLRRHIMPDSTAVEQKLEAAETTLAASQRELRLLVTQLRPRPQADAVPERFEEVVSDLGERMKREWNLAVTARVELASPLPGDMARTAGLMIHEALANAARHGGATTADVQIHGANRVLTLSVSDNGCGFGFVGRRTGSELAEEHLGPESLSDRVASLRGTLSVDSHPAGACVEMRIPYEEPV